MSLPKQTEEDINECVNAYYYGKAKLLILTLRAIFEARKLTLAEQVMFKDAVRKSLMQLGYLEVK